ncbi:hypothetical protein DFH06DRAFT_1345033 [Mycena polygramma]|nr:hypothetical protein DFH06DRAFT_1345033 [Mycena polygramma]
MLALTIPILILTNAALSTLAIPVDLHGRSNSNLTAPDFASSWGPSVLLDLVAYRNTNHTSQQLCHTIGTRLAPLADNFWKDSGGNMKTITGAVPLIAEAAVKWP